MAVDGAAEREPAPGADDEGGDAERDEDPADDRHPEVVKELNECGADAEEGKGGAEVGEQGALVGEDGAVVGEAVAGHEGLGGGIAGEWWRVGHGGMIPAGDGGMLQKSRRGGDERCQRNGSYAQH